ncbi:MAG: cytochrome c oxidase subunit II [Gemmatimonadales bacterium]
MTPWGQAHSALDPAGAQLALIVERLWDPMYAGAVATFVLVAIALGWALVRRRATGEAPEDPRRERGMRLTVGLATALTVAVLLVLLGLDISVSRATTASPGKDALQIRVTGHQWWWEVQYRDSVAQRWVTTANEVHVPVGRMVVLELRSGDVIHSVWPISLTGKRDQIPGKENSMWLRADRAGVYRGQCAEYCGHQHAKMAFLVVAERPDSFARWLVAQRDTAATPSDSLSRRGQEVFLASSCVMCHAVAGTPAGSRIGPDLTHLGSRRTIAAGTLPNTRGNLAGWILDPQSIKPGAKMPPNNLTPADLRALLAYLETLR